MLKFPDGLEVILGHAESLVVHSRRAFDPAIIRHTAVGLRSSAIRIRNIEVVSPD
jgi:hypothetical protein